MLTIKSQCYLAGVARSAFYTTDIAIEQDEYELLLLAEIDAEYTRHPFYGSRKMVVYLRNKGHIINRKRVQRLMGILCLSAIAPGSKTSKPHPENKIYPYLLRDLEITHPNHVWSTDITYIRLAKGFAYLTAVIDWYSRKVLSWQISNTLDSGFCVDCLEEAILKYGKPLIFNTDQGSQFTSNAFTDLLKTNDIQISMDGRGRALDNIFVERLWRSVKYEDVYLKGYASITELQIGLSEYFTFYNNERFHQSLNYSTPDKVYATANGGGAIIIDKFKK